MPESGRTRRRCIFCGGRPLNREHVWPDWYAKLVKHRGSLHRTSSGRPPTVTKRLKERVKKVCKEGCDVCATGCNGGWMGDLEGRISRLLGEMALTAPNRSVRLSETVQETLARWAVKTALVMDHVIGDGPSIHPEVARHFYELQNPGPATAVGLAAYLGTTKIAHAQQVELVEDTNHPLTTFVEGGDLDDAEARYSPFVITTFTLYRVVFQVLTYWGRPRVPLRRGPDWEDRIIRIWPPLSPTVEWPANALAFDDAALEGFCSGVFFGPGS